MCTIKAVILAAGSSLRMGCPKQLLEVDGEAMLDHAISAVMGAGITKPVLVLGANHELILEGSKLANSCEVVVNPEFEKGQASSLVVGTKRVLDSCDAALFMLCDQPFVKASLVSKLLSEFTLRQPDLLYPVYQQKRGNPVIVSQRLFSRLLNVTGDTGARFLFRDTQLNIYACEVEDRGVLIDIDTQEEYEAVK